MKIATWNCNMAFRKKAPLLLPFNPDILVIPECEHPDKLKFPAGIQIPSHSLWFGSNRNKGLGIFSYGDHKLKLLEEYNPAFKFVVPIKVTSQISRFMLYAVWANNPSDKEGAYVTQVWKAINHYDRLLSNRKTILIGDFNSNTIWDKPRRQGNHSTVVKFLENKKIYSTYHHYYGQEQGKELHPTLFMYRHLSKPYHLDYCFASKKLLKHLRSVEIGTHETWCRHSDHVPLFVEFG